MKAKQRRALAILSLAGALLIATSSGADPAPSLRVGAAGSEPFVVSSGEELGGLSVEVWRAVAAKAGFAFTVERQASVSAALAALADGKLDVVVGPVSITAERAKTVRFTQPYFQSRLSILAPPSRGLARLAPLLSKAFAAGVGALLLVLVIVGTLLWLAERKDNSEQFPPRAIPGIGNGMWLAVVTLTTVGYGDRYPVSRLGRVIAGIWMVVALISASSLTAGIATGLTLLQLRNGTISQLSELEGLTVAVVKGSTGADLAAHHGARLLEAKTLLEGMGRVESGQAKALVFDRPMLEYYVKQNPTTALEVSKGAWEPQGYGFAMRPNDDTLVSSVNIALLELTETGGIDKIVEHWLGSAELDAE